MCGRATLSSPAEDIAEIFDAPLIDIGPPRFNIAPTQPILTVRSARAPSEGSSSVKEGASNQAHKRRDEDHGRDHRPRELALVRWGLIPWWAKADEVKKIASKCIQARAETAVNAPAFRDAFRRHRCLVIVDGFFEWKQLPDGRRILHLIRQTNRKPFAIAGVWDSWRPKGEDETKTDADTNAENTEEVASRQPQPAERIESCAVLTTRSAGPIHDLHTRMPLVLAESEWDAWLEGSPEEATQLLENSRHLLDERANSLVMTPVSTWVNNVKNDDPKCIEEAPIEALDSPIAKKKKKEAEPPRQIGFSFMAADESEKKKEPRKKASRHR